MQSPQPFTLLITLQLDFFLILLKVLRQMSHGRPADVYTMGMFLFQLLFPLDFANLQVSSLVFKSVIFVLDWGDSLAAFVGAVDSILPECTVT